MMNCSKNMIRVGAGLATVLFAAYLALPEFRTAIVGLAPFAVALVCPLSMLLMMKMMMSKKPEQEPEKAVVPVEGNPAKSQEATS
jgi:hypothetical protein